MPNKPLFGCLLAALAGYSILLTAGEEPSPAGVLTFAEEFAGADAHIQCERAAALADLEDGYAYAFKIDGPPQALTYPVSDMGGPPYDEDSGQLLESITFSDTTTKEFRWETEGAPIDAVIIKGGPGANIYFYDPQASGDGLLQSPLNSGSRQADVSHVTFCWNPLKCDDPAPLISHFGMRDLTRESGVITWKTDIPATSMIKIRNAATTEESFSDLDNTLKTEHAVLFDGLTPNTLYTVTAISSSCSGLTTATNGLSFRTRR